MSPNSYFLRPLLISYWYVEAPPKLSCEGLMPLLSDCLCFSYAAVDLSIDEAMSAKSPINLYIESESIAALLAMAPFGVTLQVLSKADAIVELALVLLAGAALSCLRLHFHLSDLVLAPLDGLGAAIVLALGAHAFAVALDARFQADAVLFPTPACASAMDLLGPYRR